MRFDPRHKVQYRDSLIAVKWLCEHVNGEDGKDFTFHGKLQPFMIDRLSRLISAGYTNSKRDCVLMTWEKDGKENKIKITIDSVVDEEGKREVRMRWSAVAVKPVEKVA